jgi:hypothetical protein
MTRLRADDDRDERAGHADPAATSAIVRCPFVVPFFLAAKLTERLDINLWLAAQYST